MEELHDHDLTTWEGEGGHHGEANLQQTAATSPEDPENQRGDGTQTVAETPHDRPAVPTLEEVRAAGYGGDGVAESIVARQEELLKVWLDEHAGDDSPAEAGAALEAPEPELLTMAAGSSNARPKVWTIDELVQEYFPGATRVSGGVAAGLQRELRRRNRLAEKGY